MFLNFFFNLLKLKLGNHMLSVPQLFPNLVLGKLGTGLWTGRSLEIQSRLVATDSC